MGGWSMDKEPKEYTLTAMNLKPLITNHEFLRKTDDQWTGITPRITAASGNRRADLRGFRAPLYLFTLECRAVEPIILPLLATGSGTEDHIRLYDTNESLLHASV